MTAVHVRSTGTSDACSHCPPAGAGRGAPDTTRPSGRACSRPAAACARLARRARAPEVPCRVRAQRFCRHVAARDRPHAVVRRRGAARAAHAQTRAHGACRRRQRQRGGDRGACRRSSAGAHGLWRRRRRRRRRCRRGGHGHDRRGVCAGPRLAAGRVPCARPSVRPRGAPRASAYAAYSRARGAFAPRRRRSGAVRMRC